MPCAIRKMRTTATPGKASRQNGSPKPVLPSSCSPHGCKLRRARDPSEARWRGAREREQLGGAAGRAGGGGGGGSGGASRGAAGAPLVDRGEGAAAGAAGGGGSSGKARV